jgi:putative salt-induced outer membrane protein YdiY
MTTQWRALILAGFILASAASADQVVFRNGDRLTGKIETAADGKLTFQSQVAGKVTIALADIQTFSTDEAVELHLKDGAVVKRKVQQADPNRIAIESGETIQPQALRISDIVTLNPPPTPPAKWTGLISAGWTITSGNTHIENRNLSANAVRRSENDRITLNMDYARSRQEVAGVKNVTEDWWRSRAQYDYYVSKKLYVYGDGRYEKDAIAKLDRRVLVGGGAGYQWIETDRTQFRTAIGAASRYEAYTVPGAESQSATTVQVGYSFAHKLCKTVDILNNTDYYPDVKKFSDYYLSSTAEVRAHLTPRMFANFKVIFNYDKTPAPGQGDTDFKYLLGIGLSF